MIETGWNDFKAIVDIINKTKHDIERIGNDFKRLKELKDEVLDDPTRKAEAKKVADVNPDFSIAGIMADYTKIKALNDHLISEGFYIGE